MTTLSYSEDVEKLEFLCISYGNIKCYKNFGKVLKFYKKLNIYLPYNNPFYSQDFYQKKKGSMCLQNLV